MSASKINVATPVTPCADLAARTPSAVSLLPFVVTGDPMMLWSKSALLRAAPDAGLIAARLPLVVAAPDLRPIALHHRNPNPLPLRATYSKGRRHFRRQGMRPYLNIHGMLHLRSVNGNRPAQLDLAQAHRERNGGE